MTKIIMRKSTIKTDEFIRGARFCVECGEELENFSLQQGESNDETRNRFHNCCKTGKFNGDVCSRIFINEYDENSISEDDQKNISFPEDEGT